MPIESHYQRLIVLGLLTGFISSFNGLMTPLTVEARPLGSPKGISKTGSVRGGCPALDTKLENRKLMALVDTSDPTLTTQLRPTFWVYVPFSRTEDVTTAEFELFDENMDPVLTNNKITISLPTKAGLARFTLPANEQPLAAGKEYFWVFRIVCDQDDRSGNPSVSGWIKRIAPEASLVQRLKTIPQVDQYKVYAENNIWLDQINLLAQNSAKHTQEWTKLLNSFGLRNFAQQTVIDLEANTQ